MQYHCETECIAITAGTINEESVKGELPKVQKHMFVKEGEKAGWYDLPHDKLPKHQTFPSKFQEKLEAWKKVMTAPGLG